MSSGKRRLVTAVLSAAIVMLAAGAHAQTLGVRSGASVGPDQFFVGATYELGPYWNNRIWVRPGADAGFGNDLTLITGSFDVIHWRPVGNGRNPWMMFAGAGPAINHYRFTGFPSSTETGANVLAGVMHPSGWSGEFRVGFMNSPDFRFGIGYSFGGVKYVPNTAKARSKAKPAPNARRKR
jgi:hypothetical protein